MAFAYTIDGIKNMGAVRMVHGSFTSADGDTQFSMAKAVHGLNVIQSADIALDMIGGQPPKITVASDVVTADWDDTQGNSGKFALIGR